MSPEDRIRIPIDRQTHRILRIEAARRGITIKDLIAWLVKKEGLKE